jgi:toxin HigB-1
VLRGNDNHELAFCEYPRRKRLRWLALRSNCQRLNLPLHIAFESRMLRDACRNESAAADAFGTETAEFLRARLADMIVAETLAELVTGNPRPAPNDESGKYVVDLGDRAQLFFRANHPKTGSQQGQHLRPDRISRVIVISVEVSDV